MKDRDELVELMARAYEDARPFTIGYTGLEAMGRALDALEAAGCTVVPNEATEEMFTNASNLPPMQLAAVAMYQAMLAASPYRRKP